MSVLSIDGCGWMNWELKSLILFLILIYTYPQHIRFTLQFKTYHLSFFNYFNCKIIIGWEKFEQERENGATNISRYNKKQSQQKRDQWPEIPSSIVTKADLQVVSCRHTLWISVKKKIKKNRIKFKPVFHEY